MFDLLNNNIEAQGFMGGGGGAVLAGNATKQQED